MSRQRTLCVCTLTKMCFIGDEAGYFGGKVRGIFGGAEVCLYIGNGESPFRRDQIRNWFGFDASSSLILSSVLLDSMTKVGLIILWSFYRTVYSLVAVNLSEYFVSLRYLSSP